jgi:hypothetical protein
MKVSELIEQLGCFPEDAEVHFAYGAGDYWRTVLAPKVTRVFEGEVVPNDYHRSFKLVEDRPDDEDECITVVVIE